MKVVEYKDMNLGQQMAVQKVVVKEFYKRHQNTFVPDSTVAELYAHGLLEAGQVTFMVKDIRRTAVFQYEWRLELILIIMSVQFIVEPAIYDLTKSTGNSTQKGEA